MTDKLRKYVLPNIPYVFIGWVFLKLGTAYRLAAGGDFAHKLLGLGQTVGAAFAEYSRLELKRAKSRQTPIREQLRQAEDQVKKQPQRALPYSASRRNFFAFLLLK